MSHFFHSWQRVTIIDDRTNGVVHIHDECFTEHIIMEDDFDPEQDEEPPHSPWDDRFGFPPPSDN